jgi:hypothetical protein
MKIKYMLISAILALLSLASYAIACDSSSPGSNPDDWKGVWRSQGPGTWYTITTDGNYVRGDYDDGYGNTYFEGTIIHSRPDIDRLPNNKKDFIMGHWYSNKQPNVNNEDEPGVPQNNGRLILYMNSDCRSYNGIYNHGNQPFLKENTHNWDTTNKR